MTNYQHEMTKAHYESLLKQLGSHENIIRWANEMYSRSNLITEIIIKD